MLTFRQLPKLFHNYSISMATKYTSTSTSIPAENITREPILTKIKKNSCIISLNRPNALNSLSLEMIHSLTKILLDCEANPDIKLMIVRGEGDKAFCAGGDVVKITQGGIKGLASDFFWNEYILDYLTSTLTKPYISLYNGISMGGGIGISVHGKYRLATDNTVFAMPETAIGFHPDVGGSYFLSKLDNNLGMYLGLTGYRLKSVDVYYAGIATHYISHSNVNTMAERLAGLDEPLDIQKIITNFHDASIRLNTQEFSLSPYINYINYAFSGTSVEDILFRLSNINNDWSNKCRKTLLSMSPTALKVTFKSINSGQKSTLIDSLRMEYNVSMNCMANKDFYEGVRAILIDKDNNPIWVPNKLEDVTHSIVNSYFTDRGGNSIPFIDMRVQSQL